MSNTNCPVSMEIIPGGVGWADVKVNIFEVSFTFVISYIGDSISDLVERVYYLYPIFDHDDYDYRIMEYYEEVEAGEIIDGEEIGPEWENIPWRTELLWDGEGSSVKWTFERPKTIKADCDLTLTLEVSQEEESIHHYTVRYKDFCYALAKAVTEVFVRYGIVGYFESTWMEDINLRHFLRIKEFALDESIKVDTESPYFKDNTFPTRLGQELDLLLKPMP